MEFRDLKKQYEYNKKNIDNAIQRVINSSRFIGGSEVENLEKELANYVGVDYCITCANGTDALKLVLMGWGIGPGDAVFVPNFTFFATAEVVSNLGATPVFVDVDNQTFNMKPSSLEEAIRNIIEEGELNPKVVIPVDLFGLPANYAEIDKIASKYNLLILEDGAQGFGGNIKGKRACSFGHAATTSFFPAKPLGCYGDGGAIFTNDKALRDLIISLKVHGKGKDKYDNVRIGMNSRLDSIQAAILREKLKVFDEFELSRINEIASIYDDLLGDYIKTPIISRGYYSSYAQYTIVLGSKEERELFISEMKKEMIPTMVYYPRVLSDLVVYSNNKEYCSLDVSRLLSQRVLSLPIHSYMNEEEVERVCRVVKKVLG
ncbi:MAG: DegT/DnrJ/EryC1/StrS family aminotransferase [Firmicutes bacterium]|nr:DegT/DnrJ/EryC1/StrS family aminotransferase [Bacillota bacterium]